MKKLLKKITHPILKKYHFWYHKKPRKYVYKDVYTIIQPTVFSPKSTLSTKVFLDYISNLNLKNKSVLELGCGSGIISVFCALKGAKVTASDINKVAIDSLQEVSKKQGFEINCVLSDLFDSVNKSDSDYIFINPPYYPKKPKNIEEQAWFCGENFEYFSKLFSQLKENISESTITLLILSDACDLENIKKIAIENNLIFKKISTKKLSFETNYIFHLKTHTVT